MKILFLKQGSFSQTNASIYKLLKKKFPESEIITIDSMDIIKQKIPLYLYLINIYFFIKEYGIDIISGQKKMKEILVWFCATSYISIQIGNIMKKLIKNQDFDFVFQTQALFNCKIEGIPYFIYTDHTFESNLLYPNINPKQYMRSKRFINKSEIKIFKDATLIFTFGNFITNSLIDQYNISAEKIVTVFAGNNVINISNENPKKYSLKNILFVGIDWERKGGPTLLKVFEKVLLKHPDASLTIVGCKPKNISLPNCKIVGEIPVEHVSQYYNLASVFCMPTMREPFGIVFVEAMNFKLPIVANNIGCLPDLVVNDYNGYLINNNIEDYSQAICKLFDDPLRCMEMGENGYQYSKSKFEWDIVGEMIKNNIENFTQGVKKFSSQKA